MVFEEANVSTKKINEINELDFLCVWVTSMNFVWKYSTIKIVALKIN